MSHKCMNRLSGVVLWKDLAILVYLGSYLCRCFQEHCFPLKPFDQHSNELSHVHIIIYDVICNQEGVVSHLDLP